MKYKFVFSIILIFSILTVTACKADDENFNDYGIRWCSTGVTDAPTKINPLFDDVKKVNILLLSIHVNEEIGAPKILFPENLGPFIKRLYEARFEKWQPSKEDGRRNIGCYGRDNQNVELFYFSDKKQKEAAIKQAHDSGVLTVYIRIKYVPSKFIKPPMTEDFTSLSLLHYRSDVFSEQSLKSAKIISHLSDEETARDSVGGWIAAQTK